MDIASYEQAMVGGLIRRPDWIQNVIGNLRAEDFSSHKAKGAYLAITSLWTSQEPVDMISVAAMIQDPIWIAEAVEHSIINKPEHYSAFIRDEARTRRVDSGLQWIAKLGTADERLSAMYQLYCTELAEGKKDAGIGAVLRRFELLQAKNRERTSMGWPTGIQFLEDAYIQFCEGHVWLIGGFTSVGKTATMIQHVCNLITLDPAPRLVIVSTEMTEEQVVGRILANLTGVASYRIISGHFRHGEEEVVQNARRMVASAALTIHDDIYEVRDIEAALTKANMQGGVDVAIVDYVQNCILSEAPSQYQEQAQMAKRFQKMAKDIRCTLVCLSQLSNSVGRGETDQLEFKGAGEWAAVSDIGILLQRSKKDDGRILYDVKKNRHGKRVAFTCEYKMDFTSLHPVEIVMQK